MTDKELRKLTRHELLEIMLEQSEKLDEQRKEIRKLQRELEDKRIPLENAGNIAEAALGINKVFASAQKSADQYLENIGKMAEETELLKKEEEEIVEMARSNAKAIEDKAKEDAERIVKEAQETAESLLREAREKAGMPVRLPDAPQSELPKPVWGGEYEEEPDEFTQERPRKRFSLFRKKDKDSDKK